MLSAENIFTLSAVQTKLLHDSFHNINIDSQGSSRKYVSYTAMHVHVFCLPEPGCSCKHFVKVHLSVFGKLAKDRVLPAEVFPKADMAGLCPNILRPPDINYCIHATISKSSPRLGQFLIDIAHAHTALEHCEVLLWGAYTDSGLMPSIAKQRYMRKRPADLGYDRGDLHSVQASVDRTAVLCACMQAIVLVQHGYLNNEVLYTDRCSADDINIITVFHCRRLC